MAIEFDTCCGCIELRKGCFIIAYVNLILGSLYSGLYITSLISLVPAMKILSMTKFKTQGIITIVILVVLTITYLLQLIFTIVLLLGLRQNKRIYVNTYIKFSIFFLTLTILCSLINIFVVGIVITNLIINIIPVGLNIHYVLVIRYYYRRMEERNNVV